MWWGWHKSRWERKQLEDTYRKLERECEREKKVNEVMARMEAARRRNHFGESAVAAMRRRHA